MDPAKPSLSGPAPAPVLEPPATDFTVAVFDAKPYDRLHLPA